jgi:hypothetical protein
MADGEIDVRQRLLYEGTVEEDRLKPREAVVVALLIGGMLCPASLDAQEAPPVPPAPDASPASPEAAPAQAPGNAPAPPADRFDVERGPIDTGGIGLRTLVSPFVRADLSRGGSGAGGDRFLMGFGFGLFMEGMSPYVGGGMEIAMLFPLPKEACPATGPCVGVDRDSSTPYAVSVTPYVKARIPIESFWEPYAILKLGYLTYTRAIDTVERFDGLSTALALGVLFKATKHFGVSLDFEYQLGACWSHGDRDLQLLVHALNFGVGLHRRF